MSPVRRPPTSMRACATWLVCLAVVLSPSANAHEGALAAIRRLDQQLASQPDSAELLLQRADARRLAARWKGAWSDLGRVRELAPDTPREPLVRARLLADQGASQSALKTLDSAQPAVRQLAGARDLRVSLLLRLGRVAEAEAELERGCSGPERPTPALALQWVDARIRLHPDNPAPALVALDACLERLGPAPALVSRGIELELDRGQPQRALERHAAGTRPRLRGPAWHERRGELHLAAGAPVAARGAWQEALAAVAKRPPNRRSAPAMLALVERVQGHLQTLDGR